MFLLTPQIFLIPVTHLRLTASLRAWEFAFCTEVLDDSTTLK